MRDMEQRNMRMGERLRCELQNKNEKSSVNIQPYSYQNIFG